MKPRVVAVCRGTARPEPWTAGAGRTAIDKRPVDGPVQATQLGLEGDEVGDTRFHGGLEQALYAYAEEDADHWTEALGRDVVPGAFGENLRTRAIELTDVLVGERWSIGATVVVEVSAPRIPCRTLAGFWDVPDLVSRFVSAGRPGTYLRVLEEGPVQAGDRIRVVERPHHDVTVGVAFRAFTTERALLPSLRAAGDALARNLREVVDGAAD